MMPIFRLSRFEDTAISGSSIYKNSFAPEMKRHVWGERKLRKVLSAVRDSLVSSQRGFSCHPPKLYIYFVKNIKQYLKRRPPENILRNRSWGQSALRKEKKSLDGFMLRKTGRKSFKILINAERGKNLIKIFNMSSSRKKLKFWHSYFGSVSLNLKERKIAETLRRGGGGEGTFPN
jgi:hypothetical protein